MKYSPETNQYGNPLPQFLQHDSFLEFISSENVLRIMIGFMIGSILSRFANKLNLYERFKKNKWNWKELAEILFQFLLAFYGTYIMYRILIGFRTFSLKTAYENHAKSTVDRIKSKTK